MAGSYQSLRSPACPAGRKDELPAGCRATPHRHAPSRGHVCRSPEWKHPADQRKVGDARRLADSSVARVRASGKSGMSYIAKVPESPPTVRLAELVATLSLGTDLGLGQSMRRT